MRTTVDLPDELFRQVKATAALRGCKFKDLVEESLRKTLELEMSVSEPPTLYELMKPYLGIVDSGVTDLATNPKHMEGFGRDSMGHR